MGRTSHQNIEQPIGRILSHAGRRFLYLINEDLSSLDIDRNFYSLLLIEQGEGQITQQDLAGLMGTDKVSIVRTVDYLCDRGYVTRDINSNDKRKYSLQITEKAKKYLPQIKKTLKNVTKKAFKGLEPDEISAFLKTINIIKNNLDK